MIVRKTSCQGNVFPGNVLSGKVIVRGTSVKRGAGVRLQESKFFSSLQSCRKSDSDFVRLPQQTYLFTVLFGVFLYGTYYLHVVLWPRPLAPDPSDATDFSVWFLYLNGVF